MLTYPAADRITCREWLALGLIALCFALLVVGLIASVLIANRVLKAN